MSIVNKCRNAEPGNPDPAIPNLAAAFEIRDSYYKCFLNVSVGRQKSELASGLHISYILFRVLCGFRIGSDRHKKPAAFSASAAAAKKKAGPGEPLWVNQTQLKLCALPVALALAVRRRPCAASERPR